MLMFIGMLLEMGGLGILAPILSVMLDSNISVTYPAIKPFLIFLRNPSQELLILLGLSSLIIFYFIKVFFLGYLSWYQSKFTSGLSEELSRELFKGYLNEPYVFHLQNNSAKLIRNIQTEINQFQLVAKAVILLCMELSLILGLIIILIIVEPFGAIIIVAFMYFASILFNWITKKRLVRWGTLRQINSEKINIYLYQGLGGIKDLKLLGKEEYFLKKFSIYNKANASVSAKVGTFYLLPRLYFELLAVIGLSGMIIVMVLQNRNLTLLVPTLGIFVAAAFRMIPSFNRIMSSLQQVQFAIPVVDVLYKEFSSFEKNDIKQHIDAVIVLQEKISLENVVFKYHESAYNALETVNIEIKAGETVGLIGPSGSGKSTLVDIILGLLTPVEGRVCIDNIDISGSIRSWQNNVGYVPQSIYLTDDSLLKNVAFGVEDDLIDYSAVERAINVAQLKNFVETLPEKLNTLVGERGVRLSGGQRQRIGIARALYHEPSVLILDEATSALDNETEEGVMEAIDALHGKKTIVIVAHRLTTVKNCDKIFSMNKGSVELVTILS